MHSVCNTEWTKYRVLAGVILLNFSGGLTVFYGNLHAYTVSYMKFIISSNRFDLTPAWILSTCLAILPIGGLFADIMKRKIGLRLSVFLGILFHCTGYFLSYLSIQHSIWATTLSLGVIGMSGLGVIEILSYSFTSSWFSHNKGLAGSAIGASAAVGAIMYNSIITAYINPRNLRPDFIQGKMAYFTQSEILDRVPMTFIVLGIVTLVFQILGFLMAKTPDFTESEKEVILKKTENRNFEINHSSSNSSSESSLSSDLEEIGDGSHKENNERIKKKGNESSEEKNDIVILACEDGENDLSPKRILKSVTFYLLSSSIMALSLGMLVVSNYYKVFAQLWIPDDAFLTIVGDSSAITSTLIRVIMGYLSDKFRMKSVFIATMSIASISMTLWYFTAIFNRWMYFTCTNVLSSLTGSVFTLYPIASMKFFGLKHFATNTGLIMLAMTVMEEGSAPVMILLIEQFGWFGLFFSTGILLAASFFAITLLMPRDQIL